ncbi:hypothetical protein [Streptomyces sp. 7N604]
MGGTELDEQDDDDEADARAHDLGERFAEQDAAGDGGVGRD